jgi:hypothetical protein
MTRCDGFTKEGAAARCAKRSSSQWPMLALDSLSARLCNLK